MSACGCWHQQAIQEMTVRSLGELDDFRGHHPWNNKSSYKREDSRMGNPCKIISNRTMYKKCMEAWRLQLVSRSEQRQCINNLYFSAYIIFILHFGCPPLLILVQETFCVFRVFCVFSWVMMVDRQAEVER